LGRGAMLTKARRFTTAETCNVLVVLELWYTFRKRRFTGSRLGSYMCSARNVGGV
jgi:hypothetical protein